MRTLVPLLVAAILMPMAAQATVYTGPTAMNIDQATSQDFSFSVTDAGTIGSLSVFIQTDNQYADDVSFTLSHLGRSATFYVGNGDTYGSVIDATFSDAATTATPYNGSVSGTVLPANPLSVFSGLAIAGTYTISTIDKTVPGDGTSLLASSINVTSVSVPEPGTAVLVGTGLLAMARTRRRIA